MRQDEELLSPSMAQTVKIKQLLVSENPPIGDVRILEPLVME